MNLNKICSLDLSAVTVRFVRIPPGLSSSTPEWYARHSVGTIVVSVAGNPHDRRLLYCAFSLRNSDDCRFCLVRLLCRTGEGL